MILYGGSWELFNTDKDNIGRYCMICVRKSGVQLSINNIYAPNDHNIEFFTFIYDKLFEHKLNFPESKVIIGGDFNLVLGQVDSVNRNSNNAESRSRKFILEQNVLLGLKDGYRISNPTGGFTWSRGNCMSRLDMILLNSSLTELGLDAKIDWGFDISDHAMLEIKFKIKVAISKGKGLFRVNTKVLENKLNLEEVQSELNFQLSHIPEHWNPHQKLDYVKMSIRSTISLISGRQAKRDESEQMAVTNQLNFLRQTKEKAITNNTNQELLLNIDRTMKNLNF